MTIGEKIRKFGQANFNSVKEFAEAMDMQPPSLQAYLKGNRLPGAKILIRLKELGCNIDWLLSEEDSLTNSNIIGEPKISYYFRDADKEFINIIRKEGIKTPEELREILKTYKKLKKMFHSQ